MQIHYLSKENSILNHFLTQIRDVNMQKDSMRFRKNIERIGEIMAYELSKSLYFENINVTTPLGVKVTSTIKEKVVLCSILRAGLALHQGFMNYFDDVENGFVSAYRNHFNNDDDFEILVEYQAAPSFENKTLILVDPMLATGQSLVAVLEKIYPKTITGQVHIAVVIAAPEGVQFLKDNLPDNYHLWIADLDEKLNEKNYIIPGLGDAGDLAFGKKL
jgi:uracil phosphoribosyltransferase